MIDIPSGAAGGSAFSVKFWGVRGTMVTPGTRTIRYGGNTSCVEMRCGGRLLVFDAGSGLYALGETIKKDLDVDIFLSHTHIDHILGFPFFTPAYRAESRIRLWAGHLLEEGRTLRDALSQLMAPPLFPLTIDFFKASIEYHDFYAGETPPCDHLKAAGIEIRTLPLNHPDRATGYRVTYQGHSVCYITDIEHTDKLLDEQLVAFLQGADLLIYDSTFDDRDFKRYVGWGHSTWQHGVRLAQAANVKKLALFHHDPGSSDDELDQRGNELKDLRPQDCVAREGLVIKLA